MSYYDMVYVIALYLPTDVDGAEGLYLGFRPRSDFVAKFFKKVLERRGR